ncbi:MAG: hypothetical protein HN909_03965 [Phycisphaerales bacterium]|jgi:hypothetical protein|nr:hypothetical protein [Phycisphaerales bacterium]MBT7170909.1 hypothetical protein [Phycisphaerales bacterium]
MDSEHRHELQKNDLETELKAIWAWIKRSGSKLFFYAALTTLILVGISKFRTMRAADLAGVQIESARYEYAFSNPTDEVVTNLVALSNQDTDERIAVLSQYRLGQVRMAQAANAFGEAMIAKDAKEADAATKRGMGLRAQAKSQLQTANTNAGQNYPMIAAKAKIALVHIAVDEGDFATAKAFLKDLKALELDGHPMMESIKVADRMVKALGDKPIVLANRAAWLPKPVAKDPAEDENFLDIPKTAPHDSTIETEKTMKTLLDVPTSITPITPEAPAPK